jgi:hypothetical protein
MFFPNMWQRVLGAMAQAKMDKIRAKARRKVRAKAKAAERRLRAWKPPPGTSNILIGRVDVEPAPPRLGTPTLSAYHRLNS